MASSSGTPSTVPALVTFTNFNPVKLTQDNYPTWLPQIVPHLKGGNLFGYVNGTFPCSDPAITTSKDGVSFTQANPAFLHWTMQDQILLGTINSALSEKMLSHVTCCTMSRDAWTTLETLFASRSKARTIQIHFRLATLKKGNASIADYYHNFQNLTDSLAAVDQLINEFEKQAFLLAGLGSDYDPFVTSVTTQVEPLSIEELYGHLLTHESHLEHNQPIIDLPTTGVHLASRQSSHRGGRGRTTSSYARFGRGRGRGSASRGSSTRPMCQICNRMGHRAADYYQRYDASESKDSNVQAYFSTPSSTTDSAWYPDSSATHQLTSDFANLNFHVEDYNGPDKVHMSNGTGLSIDHIGDSLFSSPTASFLLHNVLHVPSITKNLLSIHKFFFEA
jgi:hypothetical protein